MRSFLTAATALSLGFAVHALSTKCVNSDLCYSLSIPDTTASSGKGDIYFQISASTSYSWAALGEGSSMIGSNIFVIYTSSDGKNVTVSPRYATGYSEPQHDTNAQITLLEGSGVSNGKMIANVRCSNCQSWSGGTESFSGSTANFVYAAKSGSPLNSDSPSESIEEHSIKNPFPWQITGAKGGSANVNPFVVSTKSGGSHGHGTSGGSGGGSASAIPATCTPLAGNAGGATGTASGTAAGTPSSTLAEPSGRGCPTTWPASYTTSWPSQSPPAWVKNCYPHGLPTGHHKRAMATQPPLVPVQPVKRDDSCPAGYESTGSSSIGTITNNGAGQSASSQSRMITAHAVLACIAFVALFPIGGILIRIANFTGLVWIHAAFQGVAYIIYIVAFALGVSLATQLDYMNKVHPIIGIALFVVLFFQPIAGILHHKMFKKYGHRTLWSYIHLFHGRAAILVGMVNGGLGIQLANNASTGARIAYAVIAGCMGVTYIIVVIIGEVRRRKNGPTSHEKSQKPHQLRSVNGSESDVTQIRHQAAKGPPPPLPPPPTDYNGRRI